MDMRASAKWDYSSRWRFPAYDIVMRMPILSWSIALAILSSFNLVKYLHTACGTLRSPACAITVCMRLSVILYLIGIAGAVLSRLPAKTKGNGAEPRISAMIGSFLITALTLFPRRDLSVIPGLMAALLILGGNTLALVAILQLRKSFSIMPEARELVTSGLYRYIRHPLYLAEEIAVIGVLLQFFSVSSAVVVIAHLGAQIRRMYNEERLLSRTFPMYKNYQESTYCVFPWVY